MLREPVRGLHDGDRGNVSERRYLPWAQRRGGRKVSTDRQASVPAAPWRTVDAILSLDASPGARLGRHDTGRTGHVPGAVRDRAPSPLAEPAP